MKKHLNIKITGRVQGVWFRKNTSEQADRLGITGYVKNEPDGSVYAEAEGEEEKLKEFISWCHKGPENAKVEGVMTSEGEFKNYRGFEVR